MNTSRTVIIGVVGGAFAAWLAAAATSGTRQIVLSQAPKTSAVDLSSAELAAEIARLHDRLRPTAAPQEPARNLFEFTRNAARMPAPSPGSIDAEPAAAASEPAAASNPVLALIGVAGDGGVWTAIISGDGQLFLVKEGDLVADRYRVEHVGADSADLVLDETTSAGHAALHLALK